MTRAEHSKPAGDVLRDRTLWLRFAFPRSRRKERGSSDYMRKSPVDFSFGGLPPLRAVTRGVATRGGRKREVLGLRGTAARCARFVLGTVGASHSSLNRQ